VRGGEVEYDNTAGPSVRMRFRGLRELNVIHTALEGGAEMMYSETTGVWVPSG
jgi:hypothetical protein